MHGVISLRIDRDPDFFQLLHMRGQAKAFVATVEHRIVGCISVVYQSVFVGGEPQTIGHVRDLKVHPSLHGSRVALTLIKTLLDYLRTQDADLYFCIVTEGNTKVLPLLQGRLGIPKFESLGRFLISAMLPSPLQPSGKRYTIETAREDDVQDVCRLCNAFNKSYQLAPVLTASEFASPAGSAGDDSPMRRLVARQDGTIRATLCAFDTSGAKQNVVMGMPIILRTAMRALRLSSKVFPFWTFPNIGDVVHILYLRNAAFEDGHHHALRMLLQRVRNEAFREKYSFVVIGMHERDPLRFLVHGLPKFTFVSHGFVTSLRHDRALLAIVVSGIPMEDFALA
jgi:hypothetical protein